MHAFDDAGVSERGDLFRRHAETHCVIEAEDAVRRLGQPGNRRERVTMGHSVPPEGADGPMAGSSDDRTGGRG
jgi:hypothetical protein